MVAEQGSPVDAVQGNPAGLAGIRATALDLNGVGLVAGGSFRNRANPDVKLRGIAGALPFGAVAFPYRGGPWVFSAAVTPDLLMRANWHYVDAPGTAGISYGYQTQETEIMAIRSSVGAARSIGPHLAAGVTLGVSYNQNDLHAPYIFQQQPILQGLKVLLNLTTRGYGWNGATGLQWRPKPSLRFGAAWKSGTTIQTSGTASGTASALFDALKSPAVPVYRYHAHVVNHLPQTAGIGVSWAPVRHLTVDLEGDVIAWRQAFSQLSVSLSGGTNATINNIVGSASLNDVVPLHWSNQGVLHVGLSIPVQKSWILASGYSFASDPVPSSTLTPLTAAIMQNTLSAGATLNRSRWHYAAAYQTQLPSTQSVGVSGLLAGEYSNSRVRVWTQAVTLSAHYSSKPPSL